MEPLKLYQLTKDQFIDNCAHWTIQLIGINSSLCELILRDENGNYQGSMVTKTKQIINDNMNARLIEHALIIKNNA